MGVSEPYHVHNTLLVGQYGARVTYSSVVKLLFTLRASASAAAPDSLNSLCSRLWKRVLRISVSCENGTVSRI